MAKKSTKTQTDESAKNTPAVSEVHRRAREAVEALKAVRDELHRKAAELDRRQSEIEEQVRQSDEAQARISQAQSAFEEERVQFKAERESSEARLAERNRELAREEKRLAALAVELTAREASRKDQEAIASSRIKRIEPELVEAPRGAVEVMPVAASARPKSAGKTGATDSRKLRRNTKRKAIGV